MFIIGDDIGWMQPGIYHRGLMVGETPTRREARFFKRVSPPGFSSA